MTRDEEDKSYDEGYDDGFAAGQESVHKHDLVWESTSETAIVLFSLIGLVYAGYWLYLKYWV